MWKTMPALTGQHRGTTWPAKSSTHHTAGCCVSRTVGASRGASRSLAECGQGVADGALIHFIHVH